MIPITTVEMTQSPYPDRLADFARSALVVDGDRVQCFSAELGRMVDLQRENGTVAACSDALAVTYDSTSPGDDDKGVRSKLRTQ